MGIQHREQMVERLLASGERANGEVTAIEAGAKGGQRVVYQFTVNGKVYEGSSGLVGEPVPQVGRPVLVRYRPNFPSENTLATGEETRWLNHRYVILRVMQVVVLLSGISLFLVLQFLVLQSRSQPGGSSISSSE